MDVDRPTEVLITAVQAAPWDPDNEDYKTDSQKQSVGGYLQTVIPNFEGTEISWPASMLLKLLFARL